jgi:hypothetical protein
VTSAVEKVRACEHASALFATAGREVCADCGAWRGAGAGWRLPTLVAALVAPPVGALRFAVRSPSERMLVWGYDSRKAAAGTLVRVEGWAAQDTDLVLFFTAEEARARIDVEAEAHPDSFWAGAVVVEYVHPPVPATPAVFREVAP